MSLTTISDVSKRYEVSTRTLRYYEEMGLIKSTRKEDYAYRVYDQEAISRLQITLILRKLGIRLKEIRMVLSSNNVELLITLLNRKHAELSQEMDSLISVREIIQLFLEHMNRYRELEFDSSVLNILNDDVIVEKLRSTSLNIKMLKENRTMNEANKKIDVPDIKNVRIIHIPPMTVASSHCLPCKEPEEKAKKNLVDFIETSDVYIVKPDFRVFGFDNPSHNESGSHGYEFYITIPEAMDVAEPMTKKTFDGGLYAAHSIRMGDFHEWKLFWKWLEASDEYEYDAREPLGMGGSLEEELNAFSNYISEQKDCAQLDLLIPITKKTDRRNG